MRSYLTIRRNNYSIYAAFIMWGILCTSCNFQPVPSDKTLLENFQKNKSDYADLVRLFTLNPSLQEVSARSLSPDDSDSLGISKSDIMEYRQLCDRLEVQLLIKRGYKEIWLIKYDLHPFPPGGTYKGYALLAEPPLDTAPDLDIYWERLKQGELTESVTVYRQINKNWYLFLDYDN